MHRLRLPFLIALLIGMISLSLPASAQPERTVQRTFEVDSDVEVVFDTYKGRIEVRGWDRDEVDISARIHSDGDDELVEKTEVRFERDGDRLVIRSDYDDAKDRGLFQFGSRSLPLIDYVVRMPRAGALTIDDYKSKIDLADVRGGLNLETYKGEAVLESIHGPLVVDTYKGEVRGSIVSDDVEIETYKGDVELTGLRGRTRAETYKGTIELAYERFDGDVELDTYKGDIRLDLPSDAAFDLDAELDDDADLVSNFGISRPSGDDDVHIVTSVAGGGPRIEVESHKGRIELRGS